MGIEMYYVRKKSQTRRDGKGRKGDIRREDERVRKRKRKDHPLVLPCRTR